MTDPQSPSEASAALGAAELLLHHVVNAEGYINTSYVSKERAESIVEHLRQYAPAQTFHVVVADEQPGDADMRLSLLLGDMKLRY